MNVSNDLDLSDRIWLQIDETIVDPQVRQRLGNNGFRVGVAAVLPPELAAPSWTDNFTKPTWMPKPVPWLPVFDSISNDINSDLVKPCKSTTPLKE
ncbi:MAG: hypothetical protein R3B96_05620 [Pirellulaceae bacterium]